MGMRAWPGDGFGLAVSAVSPNDQDERVPLWSVSKRWRRQFLSLFFVGVIVILGFSSWHEIWVKDEDSPWETVMAIAQSASISFIPLAVGLGVLLDAADFVKTTFGNAKEVIVVFSEMLKDALKRHRERKAEEERREEEVARLKQKIEQNAENESLLKQQVEELQAELRRRPPCS